MDTRIARPAWQRNRKALVAGVLAVFSVLLTLAVVSVSRQNAVSVPRDTLDIRTVENTVFHDSVPLSAKVIPKDVIYLDALEGGQIARLLVKAGDRVAAGQPMIEFRNTSLELEVLDREARLVESITQLQAYEKSLEQNRANNEQALARITYDIKRLSSLTARREALLKQGFVPRALRDDARDELDLNLKLRPLQEETNRKQERLRQAQTPHVRSELETLQESLRITRDKLGELVVKAPVDGQITVLDLKVGQNRNRGDRLAEITADTGFKLAADIDEYYSKRVAVGQLAAVDVGVGRVRAKVVRVYPQVTDGRFVVDLDFVDRSPAGLLPGQAALGTLSVGADSRELVIPAGAFLEQTGGRWIFVLSDNGRTAVRRELRLGRRNPEQVEILSGLRAGERVVTSDYSALIKFQKLNLKD